MLLLLLLLLFAFNTAARAREYYTNYDLGVVRLSSDLRMAMDASLAKARYGMVDLDALCHPHIPAALDHLAPSV